MNQRSINANHFRLPTAAVLVFLCLTFAFAHPGGGLVALDANTVIFGDSTNNVLWRLEKGKQPLPVVKSFHVHWLTLGLDGHLYAESFGEMGGALFRIYLNGQEKVKVAEESEINAHVFAVGKDGEIIFQKGSMLVERRADGTIKPFRGTGTPTGGQRHLGSIITYQWHRDGSLLFADGNTIGKAARHGEFNFGLSVSGNLIEPQIWNSTGKPRIWSIAVDSKDRYYLALPDLGQVVRIGSDGKQSVIDRPTAGWRVTAVAAFDDNIFLLDSSDRSNDGPRVRVIRPSGGIEVLGEVRVETK